MGLQTYESIAAVENKGHGMSIETYQSSLAMVMSIMNHGAIGGGNGYGCNQHKAALDAIEKHLTYVRGLIEKHNSEDENLPVED